MPKRPIVTIYKAFEVDMNVLVILLIFIVFTNSAYSAKLIVHKKNSDITCKLLKSIHFSDAKKNNTNLRVLARDCIVEDRFQLKKNKILKVKIPTINKKVTVLFKAEKRITVVSPCGAKRGVKVRFKIGKATGCNSGFFKVGSSHAPFKFTMSKPLF